MFRERWRQEAWDSWQPSQQSTPALVASEIYIPPGATDDEVIEILERHAIEEIDSELTTV